MKQQPHHHVHPHPVTPPPTPTLLETLNCLWSFLTPEERMDWLARKLKPHEWHARRRHYETQARRACVC